ncbi:prepilin peptidase [Kitasatospora azatica]|uniref:prepilin peptidase n=1 Tax=Kitasatospora azatica TaxID=58347 RepID=UPI0007C735A6|nr:prepilin peptidase [Kitasatospora azatica]
MTAEILGALAGLLVAPVLRGAVARYAVAYREPVAVCGGCARVPHWLPPTGRCPGCGARFGAAPFGVEAVAAAVGAGVGAGVGAAGSWPIALVLAWVALFGVVLAFVDGAVHRLPDALTLPLGVGVAVLLAGAALVDHRTGVLTRCLLAAAVFFLLYGLLALLGPMGLGDAKLAPSLGALLAWYGWRAVYQGAFAGFLLAAAWGLLLLAARRAGRKDPLPFGPCMLLGALAGVLAGG